MRRCVLTMLAACAGSPPRAAPNLASVTSATRHAHRELIVPAMLADPGVLDRIPLRARFAPMGGLVLPVLEQTRARMRVVGELDDARVAQWIDTKDVATVAIAHAELTDRAGATLHDVTTWVSAGVLLDVLEPGRDRQFVGATSPSLRVTGWLENKAIGIAYHPEPEPPLDATATLAIVTLRTAPSATADILGDTFVEIGCVVREQRDAWRNVEISRDGIRVRAWVPADAVTLTPPPDTGTIGLGSIYTVSHAAQIDVPAGACLYEKADGDVIGVNTRKRSRLGMRRDGDWQEVYVNTTWGLRTLVVHAVGDSYESCLP